MADTSGGPGHAPDGHPAGAHTDPYSARAAVSRAKFLTGATIGLGAVIGAAIAIPSIGFVLGPSFARRGLVLGQPGPGRQPGLGRRASTSRSSSRASRTAATSPAASPSCAATTPIRPRCTTATSSRSPPTPACTSAAPWSPTPERLRLPLPRRPVRHRGPAHRRPAGPPAEPLRVHDRGEHALHRARLRDEGARTARSSSPTSGSRPGQQTHGPALVPLPAAAQVDRHEHPGSPRPKNSSRCPSTGSRSALASSRSASTSCSGTSPRTSPGCRRSARPCSRCSSCR